MEALEMTHPGEAQRTQKPRREAQEGLVIGGLVAGLSVEEAADRANVSRTVAYEALRRPDFRSRLSAASQEATASAARRAGSLMVEALDTLAGIMRDSGSDSVRARCASELLTHGARLKTETELEGRLADMNAAMDEALGFAKRGAA